MRLRKPGWASRYSLPMSLIPESTRKVFQPKGLVFIERNHTVGTGVAQSGCNMTRAQSPGGQVRFIAVDDAEFGQIAALGAIRIGVGAQAAATVFPAALATVEAQNGVESVRPL